MFTLKDAPTAASTLFSAYASFAASAMLVRSMASQLVPHQLHSYIYSTLSYLFTPLSSHLTLVIDEHSGMTRNQVYDAAELYLRTKISPSTERLRVSKTPRKKTISLTIDQGQQVNDTFDHIKLQWRYVCTNQRSESANNFNNNIGQSREKRCFELTFHKKNKDKVIDCYLPYVFAQADAIKEKEKVVKLYTRNSCLIDDENGTGSGIWGSVNLEHPATFDTMAMEPELKKMIVEDMDRFLRRREFYKKVGKAWKRGYLLYGPPGTGKSSLIAAMANYLKFDVYDLELTSVYGDSELERILLSTENRSILVIEDIDCGLEIKNREFEAEQTEQCMYQQPTNKLTLSGLLNFIDGLWSSCGEERIIVFTTNKKDRLDPALLRPGRMDVHIHMSYCTPNGFNILASNYLGIRGRNDHRLCGEIEGLIQNTEVSPAEVAEELMKSDDADVALHGLVNFLKRKKVFKNDKTEEEETDDTEIQQAKRPKMDENNENENNAVRFVGQRGGGRKGQTWAKM